MRTGGDYSTWYNGGLRTTSYFHNMIGILTETIGNPTPVEILFVPQNQLPRVDLPAADRSAEMALPAVCGLCHHGQQGGSRCGIQISGGVSPQHLSDGRNSIARGSRDTWTVRPRMVSAVLEQLKSERVREERDSDLARERRLGEGAGGAPLRYWEMLRDPSQRDPRGYILPSDQPDFLTATKFVNALIKNGITVHRAAASFAVGGKNYPAGSYIVKCAQAFRPHILDMFEPQDYPDDLLYPGGPPRRPYDNAGWTLAYQMGVPFDRILEAFDGPFEKVGELAEPRAGIVREKSDAVGYVFQPRAQTTPSGDEPPSIRG